MTLFIIGWILILIALIIVGAFRIVKFCKCDIDRNQVVLPLFLLIIGEFFTVFMTVVFVILVCLDSEYLDIFIIGVFATLSASIFVAVINFKIDYNDEDVFTYRNFWRITRTYKYSDITEIFGENKDIVLYVGKNKIRIDWLALGRRDFLKKVRKEYRKHHDGGTLPQRKPKLDLFRGNVENPNEFIFIYGLFFVIIIFGIVICYKLCAPVMPEELVYRSLAFDRYEMENGSMMLYSEHNKVPYVIWDYDEYFSYREEFMSLVESQSLFNVAYIASSGEDSIYTVYSVSISEKEFLTLEMSNQRNKHDTAMVPFLFGGVSLLLISTVIASIIVGRNPQKYSKKVIRLLFKPGYIKNENRKK